MPVSKSVFLTYSYGTLEKFHVGDFSLLLEMQTSTNTLKSNLVLSCKVEYLHFLQPRDSILMYTERQAQGCSHVSLMSHK